MQHADESVYVPVAMQDRFTDIVRTPTKSMMQLLSCQSAETLTESDADTVSRNAGEALETGSTRRPESSRDVNHRRVDQASPDASHESQHTKCHRTWRRRPPTTCRILPQGIANVPDYRETRNRHRCKQDGSKAASMTSWQCAVSPCIGGALF